MPKSKSKKQEIIEEKKDELLELVPVQDERLIGHLLRAYVSGKDRWPEELKAEDLKEGEVKQVYGLDPPRMLGYFSAHWGSFFGKNYENQGRMLAGPFRADLKSLIDGSISYGTKFAYGRRSFPDLEAHLDSCKTCDGLGDLRCIRLRLMLCRMFGNNAPWTIAKEGQWSPVERHITRCKDCHKPEGPLACTVFQGIVNRQAGVVAGGEGDGEKEA